MSAADRAVSNLLFRYAECVDDGDFDGVASLFEYARCYMAGPDAPAMSGAEAAATMRRVVRTYDGTPRTKHLVTNAIIDVDELSGTATSRSYFTVLQAIEGVLPLQAITAGRYLDRFERHDGSWRFAERVIVIEFVGDMSAHLVPGVV